MGSSEIWTFSFVIIDEFYFITHFVVNYLCHPWF